MQRPISVTFFGTLNILLGILGSCVGLFSLLHFIFIYGSMVSGNPQLVPPNIDIGAISVSYLPYNIANQSLPNAALCFSLTSTKWLLSVVLLAAGVGLLIAKEWARRACLYYAVAQLILVILMSLGVGIVLGVFEITGELGPGYDEAASGMMLGLIMSWIFLTYPALLTVFMIRPEVKAWFDAARFNGGDAP